MGTQLPLPQRGWGTASNFRAICCGQMAGWIKIPCTWYGGRPGPGDIVLYGDPAPPPKKGAKPRPQFSAHVHCGQTAGWIKMALGTEVGLGPGYIVVPWDPASLPKKGRSPLPIFGPFLLWPNCWMHQDAIWYGGRPQPRRVCVRWGPSTSPKRGRSPLPSFKG